MRRIRHIPTLVLALALLVPAGARAATVCISDTATLVTALDSYGSQGDGTTLTIKLVQGTYPVGSALGAQWHSAYPNSVGFKLLGGYTSNCASRKIDPSNTVIDGLGKVGAYFGLTVDGDANALVEGVTFTRLVGDSTVGRAFSLGLDADTSDVASTEVRNSRFINSSANAVVYLEAAQMRFVNNLVSGNSTSGNRAAAVLVDYSYNADSMLVASSNTIANNTGGPGLRVDTLNDPSARGSEISDNILWHNGSVDLSLGNFNSVNNALFVDYNTIGVTTGYSADASNLSFDPHFVNEAAGNYALASNSSAINSGSPFQVWGFPARDITGGARIVGSRIDRGAYESSIDDTTTAIVSTTADNGNNSAPISGSLRAAIKAANAASGPYTIRFNVAGGCPRLLSLAAPMLDVTGDVTIAGDTQPGWTPNTRYGAFDANLCFYINGAGNSNTPWALHVPLTAPTSARLVVRGIGFAGFNDAAIKLEGGQNHRIAGNQFGAVAFTPDNNEAIRVTGNSGATYIGGFDDEGAVNLIAGSTSAQLAGSPSAGIYLDNTAGGSVIANNVIGFQADGLGNGGNASGIAAFNSKNNVIQYNYIGNSVSNGVTLSGSGTTGTRVQYNTIGMAYDGSPAGNGGAGVLISFAAKNNTIGAPLNATWGGNFIFGSAGAGVWISPSGGSGNSVLDNSFWNSGGLDIDLGAAGPSANQSTNPATGPNTLQNYPVLATAARDPAHGIETVTGTLHSAPSTIYRLDLYYGPACSGIANGRGTARYPLQQTWITTGALGDVPFTTSVFFSWGNLPLGVISATATDPAGNTSELGNCVAETLADRIFANGFD